MTLLAGACAPFGTDPAPFPGEWFRIVEASAGTPLTIAALGDKLTDADVVFFGEQHDDPGTHRAQRELLEEIARTSRTAVVSLEMLERDVQSHVDDYLSGAIPESEFLAQTRPWPRYATDFRPLVEAARRRGWPVVAANIPRSIAAAVGRQGLAALDSLQPADRANVALSLHCPDDAYRRRFLDRSGLIRYSGTRRGNRVTPWRRPWRSDSTSHSARRMKRWQRASSALQTPCPKAAWSCTSQEPSTATTRRERSSGSDDVIPGSG